MLLKRLSPDPRLAPYVEKMWLFESAAGIPAGDMRTVVPNGLVKMIVSFRGSLTSSRGGRLIRVAHEGSISFIGLMEQPVTVDSAGPTGSVGIELKPESAYRFFSVGLGDMRNRVEFAGDVLGRAGSALEQRVAESRTVEAKIDAVQRHLLSMLRSSRREDRVVEWAVARIRASAGMVRTASRLMTPITTSRTSSVSSSASRAARPAPT